MAAAVSTPTPAKPIAQVFRPIQFTSADRPDVVDAGPAPMLQWLPIDSLVIDDSYQRDLKAGNWAAIRRIVQRFRWSMFSPVFVAPVEGGGYAIIDGQHRTHAAAICGFEAVPCQIVQMNREEQAAAFAAVNGVVTKVTHWHLFKAALRSGEDWATNAASIASEAGCELMTANTSHFLKKPGQIFGVKAFRGLVDARPRAHAVAALAFLRRCEEWRSAPEYWDAGLLIPVALALSERPLLLSRPEFQRAFEEFDIWKLLEDDKRDRRERIKRNLPYQPKSETLRASLIEWMDSRFPVVIGGPSVHGEAGK